MKKIIAIALLLTSVAVCHALEATIAWNPVTEATDGNALTVSGYRLYYGTVSGELDSYVEVQAGERVTLTDLEYNTQYFFAAVAIASNRESALSQEISWTTPSMLDTDGDNLADDWEILQTGSLESLQADGDLDGDGVSDYAEFIAGTDAANAHDFPRIEVNPSKEGVTIAFTARPVVGDGYNNRQRVVTLMQCDDPSTGIWTPVAGYENIVAAGQLESVAIDAAQMKVYYRTDITLL